MRERVPPGDEERERRADETPQQQPHPSAMALQLQTTAGNQATTQMVQRFGLGPAGILLDKGFDYAWDKFVESNRESSSYYTIDAAWKRLAYEYSVHNPDDGQWISWGIKRLPGTWVGSWVLERAGDETNAITLDRDIFFNPDVSGEPNVDTYIHELVHVAQYGLLGVKGFLGSYAAEFVKGLVGEGGDDTKAYHAIAHEKQAAAVEKRFQAWRENKEKEDALKPKPPTPSDPVKDADDAMRQPRPISDTGAFPLGGSVGAKGDNRPEDIQRVASRLHTLGFLDPMTTDIEKVTDAIEEYQGRVLGWPRPDGRVDVNNKTHKALKLGRKGSSMAL